MHDGIAGRASLFAFRGVDGGNTGANAAAGFPVLVSDSNLLSDRVRTYQYDHANRLKQVTEGSLTTQFAYNGDGVRVGKTIGAATTEYVLDLAATLPVVISDTDALYLYGLDIIAEQLAGADRYYYMHDGLGSVRQVLDSAGQIIAGYAYDPFGVPLAGNGVPNPWQFTGEGWDAGVELLYLRARYYQPETGRFVTEDPWPGNVYSPVTIHPYQYVANRPTTSVDPTGLQDEDEEPSPKDWTYYLPVHPNYWLHQRRSHPRALAWAAALPWRVVPDNYCLPGDLGCWGGARYGEWVETLNLYQLGYLYGPQAPWLPTSRVQRLIPGQYDVTPWLVEQLNTTAKSTIGCALKQYYPWPGAWIGWTQLVRGGGIWDFKPDFKWQELWSVTICGKWCAFDVPANIHFGYAGRSVGFTPLQLRAGAGAAQVWDNIVMPILKGRRPNWDVIGPAALFYDEPGDVTAILIGMELYDRHGDQVTEGELCAVVDRYADPAAPLKPLHPGQPQY